MFNAYSLTVTVLQQLAPVLRALRAVDRDLADQLKRASTSVLLNLSEGNGRRGASRLNFFRIACGSAQEVGACLDAASALGLIAPPSAKLADDLDHLQRVLTKLSR